MVYHMDYFKIAYIFNADSVNFFASAGYSLSFLTFMLQNCFSIELSYNQENKH